MYHTQGIKYLHMMLFLMRFFLVRWHMSQPYAEAMDMHPAVSYTPYAISSRGETGNIITFAQFEEGNSLSETHNLLSKNCDNT